MLGGRALSEDVRVSHELLALLSVVLLFNQGVFGLLYLSRWNLRFRDPGMTVAQIVCALLWMTVLLASVEQMRGTLLLGYVVVLLFGITRLAPRTFARCAALAFGCFAALYAAEWYY